MNPINLNFTAYNGVVNSVNLIGAIANVNQNDLPYFSRLVGACDYSLNFTNVTTG